MHGQIQRIDKRGASSVFYYSYVTDRSETKLPFFFPGRSVKGAEDSPARSLTRRLIDDVFVVVPPDVMNGGAHINSFNSARDFSGIYHVSLMYYFSLSKTFRRLSQSDVNMRMLCL